MTFQPMRSRKALIAEAVAKGLNAHDAQTRMSGRSTGLALQAIGQALNFPGQPIAVNDHEQTHEAKVTQYNRIMHLISTLGLRGFQGSSIGFTITYSTEW